MSILVMTGKYLSNLMNPLGLPTSSSSISANKSCNSPSEGQHPRDLTIVPISLTSTALFFFMIKYVKRFRDIFCKFSKHRFCCLCFCLGHFLVRMVFNSYKCFEHFIQL